MQQNLQSKNETITIVKNEKKINKWEKTFTEDLKISHGP